VDDPHRSRSRLAVAVLLAVSAVGGWHIVSCANGYLLNNYPFLSPDSYDYIVEGEYLVRWLSGAPPERQLSHLRNPVFVGVMAVDAVLGRSGVVFALVSAAATCATGWLLIGHLGRFRHPAAAQLCFLAIVLLAQLNFTRIYVLSDVTCMALMIAAFLSTLRAAGETANWWWVVASAGLTALAGLTQNYGILPPTVAAAVAGASALRKGERAVAARMAAVVGTAALLAFVTSRLWFRSFPHLSQPDPLEALQMPTLLLPFYAEAWTYTFLPLAPLLLMIWLRRGSHSGPPDTMTTAAWLITLIMMVLCLCFRWRSIRFTSFFWPFLILALFRTASARYGETPRPGTDRAVHLVAAAVLLQTLFANPEFPTLPLFGSLAVDPSRSWVVQFVRARPLDRMDLASRCGGPATLCPSARPLTSGDGYQQGLSRYYEWLMLGRPTE
jgi:hypothetical protein